MNRRIRDPYVQWCERRTLSLTGGRAVYSIVRSFLLIKQLLVFTISSLHYPLEVVLWIAATVMELLIHLND